MKAAVKNSEKAGEIADPLEGLLGYELRRAAAAVMATLAEALTPLGLKTSEASMLMIIGQNPGCTQSGIARAMRAKAANLVPIINALELAGAVARTPGEGRAIALHLTPAGAALLKKVKQTVARHEAQIGRRLSKQRQSDLIAALRMVLKDACGLD